MAKLAWEKHLLIEMMLKEKKLFMFSFTNKAVENVKERTR